MRVHLRPRLEAVAAMVQGSDTLADVGCDHGRLTVSLLQRNMIQRALALDISAPSLDKARALAERCGLGSKIELRLSNGLLGLNAGEADAVVLSGMGGLLIARLLDQGAKAARAAERIVMQPMGGSSDLRRYLCNNRFRILDEELVYDGGRFYQVIKAADGEAAQRPPGWPEGIFGFGWVNLEKNAPTLIKLLDRLYEGNDRRLALAKKKGVIPERLIERQRELEAVRGYLQEINWR